MDPDKQPAPSQITIDLGSDRLVQRVDYSVGQEIIVTTADKARLCLIEAMDRMERRRAWIAPAGILATLLVVFPTTTFQDFLGFSREYWKAAFSIVTLVTSLWLVKCIFDIRRSLSIDEVVNRLRANALAPTQHRATGDK